MIKNPNSRFGRKVPLIIHLFKSGCHGDNPDNSVDCRCQTLNI